MSTQAPLPQIRLQANAYSVLHWLPRVYGEDPFDLDAPYQRGSVWTIEQRRNLIKSLIMGLPVGSLIVSDLPYRANGAHYRVVDGKQRIEAIRAFMADEFTIPAAWLDDTNRTIPADRDLVASQLTDKGRRGVEQASMPALQFDATVEWTPNPDFDADALNVSGKPKVRGDRRAVRWLTRDRTDEEILQAEAELYLLVNFGGVAQTDADRQRAESVAQ